MPSTDDLAIIRSWVGSAVGDDYDPYDNDDLDSRIGRLGTAHAAALEILRQQRADMLTAPAVLNISGDYSESRVENLKRLADNIAQLERVVGENTVSVATLVRTPRLR